MKTKFEIQARTDIYRMPKTLWTKETSDAKRGRVEAMKQFETLKSALSFIGAYYQLDLILDGQLVYGCGTSGVRQCHAQDAE